VEIENKILHHNTSLHILNFEILDRKFKKFVINGVAYTEIGDFRGKFTSVKKIIAGG
jgi:hypothetical protein